MALGSESAELYYRAFRSLIDKHPNVQWFDEPGKEFLYRPGQLLVAKADAPRVEAALKQGGYPFEASAGFAGMRLFRFALNTDIPGLVKELRNPDRWDNRAVPQVQPHHVTVGNPNVMGGPFGAPEPVAELPGLDQGSKDDGQDVVIGIADTGIWADAATSHSDWLGGRYSPESDDVDSLLNPGGLLALQAGHGTFIAGVARRAAPGIYFDPERALDPDGIGDEQMLSLALTKLTQGKSSIINLSLGCFTQDDLPSLPLQNVLDTIGPEIVIVSSAGNSGMDRPSWPAAFRRVIGVAAVEATERGFEPAPYSNHGKWVDACALGEHDSTYVTGSFWLPGEFAARDFRQYARWAGTSFAAPHVAGRIAALKTRNEITVQQAAQLLLSAPRWHPDFGVLVL